jgi:hypothetical protein
MIGDALLVRGIAVLDIMNVSSVKAHTLTPWAKAHGHDHHLPEELKKIPYLPHLFSYLFLLKKSFSMTRLTASLISGSCRS